jgi:hypothetical protein
VLQPRTWFGTYRSPRRATRCHALFGPPELDANALIDLTATWLTSGGRTLGKPTKFQVRDGKF